MRFTFAEWAEDLKAVPQEEQARWIKDSLRSKATLHIFGRFFFPLIIRGIHEVPEAHIDLIRELTRRVDSAIVFPRNHAKTTWEKIDTLHDIVYALEPVILYIGATLFDGQQHFESIKAELESNELLISVYGNLVPSNAALSHKWTNKHLETTNGVNLLARGAGKGRGVNIKNRRPTKIIMDDIENDEAVRSPEQREKLRHWINNVIIPSKDKERGFVKMIGTVISPMCELLKFYKGRGGIFRKAIENGESIWPNFWTLEDLYKIRDGYTNEDGIYVVGIGTRAFSQEYMNTPINEETAKIKPEWVEPFYWTELPREELLEYVIMFDPQAGQSGTSDFYGLAVLAFLPKDPHRYLVRIARGRDTQINQAALVVRTYQQYPRARVVGVEKIMTQVAVYQLILDWKAGIIDLPNVDNTNRNIPIIAVDPEGKDKIARLEMHEASFEHGLIHLHATMTTFTDLLVSFPEVEHDDDVDAFIYTLEWSYKTSVAVGNEQQHNTQGTIVGNVMRTRF